MFVDYLESSNSEAIFELFDIFDSSHLEPNVNHIFIARLAESGLIKTILTTNFDTLLEQAFESKKIKYQVFYKDEDFENINKFNNEIKIIKIHGSYGNGTERYKNSIVSTIKMLSLGELRYKRNKAIDFCFSNGEHNNVLILGYSCSDIFDITPQIEKIDENKKRVTFIEHRKNEFGSVEPLEIKFDKNPFKKFFNSYRVFCNTDFITKFIWNRIFDDELPKVKHINSVSWKTAITNWGDAIDPQAVRGWLYYFIGQFEKSVKNRKAVLDNLQINNHSNKFSIATAYNNVGEALYAKGEYDESIIFHGHALEIRKKVLGDESPDTATSYNNLGEIHYMKQDYHGAINFYEQSLNIRVKMLGDYNADTATSYNNLGQAYYSLGIYDKAIKLFYRSLEIRKLVLGEEHPYTAMSYNNIGATYEEIFENEKAINNYEKALEIKLKVFPKDHPSIAKTYNNLGKYYYRLNEYDTAISLFKLSLKIREEALGKNHIDTKQVLENLSNAINKKKCSNVIRNE